MNFEEIGRNMLPTDARYFFNVNLILVELPEGLTYDGYQEVWDLSGIQNATPIALHIYTDKKFRNQTLTNCVIEISDLGIAWYQTRATEIK